MSSNIDVKCKCSIEFETDTRTLTIPARPADAGCSPKLLRASRFDVSGQPPRRNRRSRRWTQISNTTRPTSRVIRPDGYAAQRRDERAPYGRGRASGGTRRAVCPARCHLSHCWGSIESARKGSKSTMRKVAPHTRWRIRATGAVRTRARTRTRAWDKKSGTG